jgi:hypothetical protein
MKQCKKCKHLRPDVEREPTTTCPKCGGEYEYIEITPSASKAVVAAAGPAARHPTAVFEVLGPRTGPFDFKNAHASALKNEYNRIAREIGDDQFFTRKELQHVPKVLGDGEQVLAFSSGLMDGHTWLIVLTDQRILFLDIGMFYGLRQAAIDLDKVNAISCETGMILGKIKVQDGAKEREILNVWKKTVLPFTNKARDAIQARKTNWGYAQAAMSPAPSDDLLSKLERLGALKDKGVLSQQEFDQQKARLLSQ